MSRYAHEHPEQFEPGGAGFEPLFDRAEERRGAGRGYCVACGDPTTAGRRWCSESCRRQEDGLSAEEAAIMEEHEEQDE